MVEFSDILYGKVLLPDWLVPFLRVPELARLRGVRLSNVNSFQFKDFSGPTRWEHCVAVASLAVRCAEKRRVSETDSVHLVLAALFHDVATPPFAHTMEQVLEAFDHEVESQRVLRALPAGECSLGFPVFASQLPQFQRVCERVSRQLGITIDTDEVARLVVGDGDLGFLINGTVDLDNADNVTRASLHMGMEVDRQVPLTIADWLAAQEQIPLNLGDVREDAVAKWLEYRRKLYSAFFNSSDEELGRQAFLQHMCRRAVSIGVPRSQLIWNTDDALLTLLETFADGTKPEDADYSLKALVNRYRLLEPAAKIAEYEIEDDETLRALRSPLAASWIERELSGPGFEPFVLINTRRYSNGQVRDSLFPRGPGSIVVFKLGKANNSGQIPPWMRTLTPQRPPRQSTRAFLSGMLRKRVSVWLRDKPWLVPTPQRKEDVRRNLDALGDWSFTLSRNEGLHPYPSTFVHAIPACLISALGLQGEMVLDPFGGTGQTAVEAIKLGGRAISADINSVAVLVAKSKLTYLGTSQRRLLREVSAEGILACSPGKPPDFELVDKWHHPETLTELCKIRSLIHGQQEEAMSRFMMAAFSGILTMTTARKGKQHGWFADNSPLAKGQRSPPYENAIALFIGRLKRNVDLIERLYSHIERSGRDPRSELRRTSVLQLDVTQATPQDYQVDERTVAAVITSPPYLCMSDYSLGQRLSYHWLFPEQLEQDYEHEIGARRRRFKPTAALDAYLRGLGAFADLCSRLLRPGGFLATVLGAPVANSFAQADVLPKSDAIMKEKGFSAVWSRWRPIHWHRNHGYAHLNQERIAVYALAK